MIKKIIFLCVLCSWFSYGNAQRFDIPMTTCSGKKISYLTLNDGTQVEGLMKSLGFKKGLIDKMKFEPTDGAKIKLTPQSIKHMYLPPSGIEKLGAALEFMHDVDQWSSRDIDQDIMGKGYVYYEKADVMIKKKKVTLMMQLLNSSFADGIRVYNDPFSKETASTSIGGFELAGGDAKSYYVKKGKGTAFRLYKKDYVKEYPKLYSDCAPLKKHETAGKWGYLEKHVYKYATECAK